MFQQKHSFKETLNKFKILWKLIKLHFYSPTTKNHIFLHAKPKTLMFSQVCGFTMKTKENTFLAIKTTNNLIFHKQNCRQIISHSFTVKFIYLKIGYKKWSQNDKKSHCLLQTKQIYLSSGKTQKNHLCHSKTFESKTTQRNSLTLVGFILKNLINLQLHSAQKRVNSQLQVKSISQHCIYIDFAKKSAIPLFCIIIPQWHKLKLYLCMTYLLMIIACMRKNASVYCSHYTTF